PRQAGLDVGGPLLVSEVLRVRFLVATLQGGCRRRRVGHDRRTTQQGGGQEHHDSHRCASLSCSIIAYAEWLWMDSKFSDSTEYAAIRSSALRRVATSRTISSTNLGLS